mmetsp:Transcript_6858/g.17136  ORF Transcript_6858/g.17136 Transcript_6858/m.17136 type:complete len:309 (+) Transcript_6858:29-955(+)
MATQTFSIFIGDLSAFCTENDIYNEFAKFGNIVDVRIKRSKETGKPLLYGFVDYSSVSSAANAIREMNGQLFKGRPLRICWATHRKPGFNKYNNAAKMALRNDQFPENKFSPSVHIRFSALDPNMIITEEALRVLCIEKVDVIDCTIKQSSYDSDGKLSGYGFITFPNTDKGINDAMALVRAFPDTLVNRVNIRCEPSKTLNTYLKQRHVQHLLEMQRIQQLQYYQQPNPYSVTDQYNESYSPNYQGYISNNNMINNEIHNNFYSNKSDNSYYLNNNNNNFISAANYSSSKGYITDSTLTSCTNSIDY